MSQYVKVVDTQEFKQLLQGDKPVVCDFWATWCQPCRMLAPVMDEIAKNMQEKAVFVKVDIDQNEELAIENKIFSIPCIKVYKQGGEVAQTVGFAPQEEMEKFISQNI